jgi:prevent-host-death family protein
MTIVNYSGDIQTANDVLQMWIKKFNTTTALKRGAIEKCLLKVFKRIYNGLHKEIYMKALKVSRDIVTLAEFKSQASNFLKRIANSSQPLLITQNGKPAGVLLSPAEFDRIQEQESIRFVTAVNRGIKDADEGKLLNSIQTKSRLGLRK